MITRRGFFGLLGKAVIGTALALKLPDSIIPIPIIDKDIKGALTYQMLLDAYNSVMKGSLMKPDLIVTNKEMALYLRKKGLTEKQGYIRPTYAEIQRDEFPKLNSISSFDGKDKDGNWIS